MDSLCQIMSKRPHLRRQLVGGKIDAFNADLSNIHTGHHHIALVEWRLEAWKQKSGLGDLVSKLHSVYPKKNQFDLITPTESPRCWKSRSSRSWTSTFQHFHVFPHRTSQLLVGNFDQCWWLSLGQPHNESLIERFWQNTNLDHQLAMKLIVFSLPFDPISRFGLRTRATNCPAVSLSDHNY